MLPNPETTRKSRQNGQVAQSVEQWTENPCVGGSIPPLSTRLAGPMCQLAADFQHIRGDTDIAFVATGLSSPGWRLNISSAIFDRSCFIL
jgi:hypothetical protein